MTSPDTPSPADLDRRRNRAALASLCAALFLCALKLVAGLATNSLAILSEALHSGLDLLAAGMTWYAIRLSSRPADQRHPYGHGRAENLSALAETLLLLGMCAYVGWEGAHRLIERSSPVVPSLWGVGVMAVSMIVDINRVRVLRRVAREARSQALEADALHFSTDILSSAVVLVGALAVWLADFLVLPEPARGFLHQADTVAALVVAVVILRASMAMARHAVDLLMDAGSLDMAERVERLVASLPGVLEVSRLRTRSSGPRTFVDLCVGVDPRLRVAEGHRVASAVEAAVRDVVPDADVTVHVDPVTPRADGPVAEVLATASACGLTVRDVHLLEREGAAHRVEVELSFDGSTPYERAHARAGTLTAALGRRLPGVEVVTRVVPEATARQATEYSPEQNALARAAREQVALAASREGLAAPHAFHFSILQGIGPSLSFHCVLPGPATVDVVHETALRMERALREALPDLGRVTIHMDPASSGEPFPVGAPRS